MRLPVRWVAVAGFEEGPLREAAAAVLPAEFGGKMKEELHVTLWHCDDPVMGVDAVS